MDNIKIKTALSDAISGVDIQYRKVFKLPTVAPYLTAALNKTFEENNLDMLCPRVENIFAAFKNCSWDKLSVIIIGQDPYPDQRDACGLAFSAPKDRPIPDSLMNIYRCLVNNCLMKTLPTSPVLKGWAQQGVLLLNTSLTTIRGVSAAHPYWHNFTSTVVNALLTQRANIIMILWGNDAINNFAHLAKNQKCVLQWGHPSPRAIANRNRTNPSNFIHCDNFIECNKLLTEFGKTPIRWECTEEFNPDISLATTITIDSSAFTRATIIHTDVTPTTCAISNMLISSSDGASFHNGKPDCVASYGYCVVTGDILPEYGLHGAQLIINPVAARYDIVDNTIIPASNNRGELHGLLGGIEAMRTCKQYAVTTTIFISSDSEYALKSVFLWYSKWISENTINEKLNTDLISKCVEVVTAIRADGKQIIAVHHPSHLQEDLSASIIERVVWKLNALVDSQVSEELTAFRKVKK